MLHAYLYTICFVFCYTSWRFYAFSETNLLMRCHSVSSLFSAIFVFQKSYTGNIFLELDKTKAKPSIFTEASSRPKMRQRGARSQPRPRVAWPTPGLRPHGVRPAGPPPDAVFRLQVPLDGKNLEDGSLFHEIYCKPPPSSSRDWEDLGALPGILPERGIPVESLLHHHGRLRTDV
jgi:hypothetical protein